MKNQFNLILLARTLIKVFSLAFLVFIFPGWNARPSLTAQVEPTKAETPTTPEPSPTASRDAGGLGIASGHWVMMASEDFEGVFPAPGWTVQDLSYDGYERFWDDDNYQFHWGAWAAWPARGGANGLNPTVGNHHYFDNMNTRLIYGPFDLRDASRADTDFYLWRELAAGGGG